MKFSIAATLFAACASAVEMKACSGANMSGTCNTKTSQGKVENVNGNWNSYNFRASTNLCVRVCSSCTSLGFRCQSYSNNNIKFNKFIVFNWANGDGPDATTCC